MACALTAGAAFSQTPPTPSQVTPRDLRPPQARGATAPPSLARAPADIPPGAEKLQVRLVDVQVEGGFDSLTAQTATLTAPLKGRVVSGAEIYQLAADLEALYARAGYPLARVVLPPQSLADGGTLKLTVVDGFIESLDLSRVPPRLHRPIQASLAPLIGQHHLRASTLERRLMLAGAAPGGQVSTTLARGDQPGGVKLIIQATLDGASASLNADNRLGAGFNDWQLNTQVSVNSPLGFGEQAYLYISTEPNLFRAFRGDAPRRVVGGGLTVPLGGNGWSLTPEFTHSDTQPITGPFALPTRGLFDRYAVKLAYPVVKNRLQTLTVTGSLEYAQQSLDTPLFGVRLNEDRLNVARLALDWSRGLDGGSLTANFNVAQGLVWAGVRTEADVAATGLGFSRFGADPQFTKLETQITWLQALTPSVTSRLAFHAQTAPKGILPSTELFSLDSAVSALTAGAVGSDSGWSLRAEVNRDTALAWGPLKARLGVYGFGAMGEASYKVVIPGQIGHAFAYGAGFRLTPAPLKGAALPDLSVEFAQLNTDGPAPDEHRVNITTGVRF